MRTQHDPGRSEFEDSYDDERTIRGAIFQESLGNVPRRPLLILPDTATVGATIKAMNEHHVGCAVIAKDGLLTGIFTERDVLRKIVGAGIDIDKAPVRQYMTENPDTLPARASIAYALHKMSVEGYRHIPLVDGQGHPMGVVAVRDIIAWMVDLFHENLLNLPPDPDLENPRNPDGG